MTDTTGQVLVCYMFGHHVAAMAIRTVGTTYRACIVMGCSMVAGILAVTVSTGHRSIITSDGTRHITR